MRKHGQKKLLSNLKLKFVLMTTRNLAFTNKSIDKIVQEVFLNLFAARLFRAGIQGYL